MGTDTNNFAALILGFFLFSGMVLVGISMNSAVVKFRQYDRTVIVKGLAEKEYPADLVLWPISIHDANNNLTQLYASFEDKQNKIQSYLLSKGVQNDEITIAIPKITDRSARGYEFKPATQLRYFGSQTITIYSKHVDTIRTVMMDMEPFIAQEGLVINTDDYNSRIQYIFTRLNEIKPQMIEEATKNARESANKFAADSSSQLGKIKRANQGQFSIVPRDKNNPNIKQIRVVSTIEYYLVD